MSYAEPQRTHPDSMAQDIDTSLDATAHAFGSALEKPTPFAIKRTVLKKEKRVGRRVVPAQRVVEYYAGMSRSNSNWATKPSWSPSMHCAVGFTSREDAQHFIDTLGLKPRAEVVEREAAKTNGR